MILGKKVELMYDENVWFQGKNVEKMFEKYFVSQSSSSSTALIMTQRRELDLIIKINETRMKFHICIHSIF